MNDIDGYSRVMCEDCHELILDEWVQFGTIYRCLSCAWEYWDSIGETPYVDELTPLFPPKTKTRVFLRLKR